MGTISANRPNSNGARMQIESLESRRMLSISLIGKTLRIAGTSGDDYIWFDSAPVSSTGNSTHFNLRVFANDESAQFEFGAVKKIVITTDAGNDEVLVPRMFLTGSWTPLGQSFENFVNFHVAIPCFIDGGAGNDTIVGGGRNDTLRGGAGDDRIDGQSGDDQLFGDSGKDTLIGGLGDDRISGGKHTDTADYSARRDDLAIFMLDQSPRATHFDFQVSELAGGAAGEHDMIFNDMENVIGGRGNDSIYGNFNSNYIVGGGGNDSLNGAPGNDTLVGGAGDDQFESFDLYSPQAPWDGVGERPTTFINGLSIGKDLLRGGAGHDRATTGELDITSEIESVTLQKF